MKTREIAKRDTSLKEKRKKKNEEMCELKRNVNPTYAVRPSALNCSEDQEQRGCSSRVKPPDRLVASKSPTGVYCRAAQARQNKEASFSGVAFAQQPFIRRWREGPGC
jgi:hypothetical protein